MVNQQLLDYIKQQLANNVSKDQIKNSLTMNGWQPSDIEEGFNALNPVSPVVPPAPVMAQSPQVASAPVGSVESSTFQPKVNSPVTTAEPLYAGFWLRAAAGIIDGFIVNLILAILGLLYYWFFAKNNPTLSSNTETLIGAISGIVWIIIWVIYFPFMESRSGATLGKKLVGIKVLNINGEPAGFLRSLGRNIAKILSALILMIGFIMVAFTKKKQGLHDMISSCVVVKTRETSAAKIWAVIILIIVAFVGAVVVAGAHILLLLSSFLSNGVDVNISPSETPITQNQDNGTESSAVPTSNFVVLTKADYDTYVSKPITGLENETDYKGPHVYAGPALIAFDDFWGLNVALPVIPNIEDNKDYVWIDLTSVISRDGKEILDKESSFETDIFFKGLSLSRESDPVEFLHDNRGVHVISGKQITDAKTIKGTLFFKIPLDSENSSNFYEKSFPFVLNI